MPQLEGLPAELAIAGTFTSAGWNVYSPHRDIGFDFIATKQSLNGLLIRPVQVKGCYLQSRKDSAYYGRTNFELKQTHPEMVLVIPYYLPGDVLLRPKFVAFLPWSQLKVMRNGNYRAQPACIKKGEVLRRRDFAKFFDLPGIQLMDRLDWRDTQIGKAT
jgi:hypothetical protein